MDQEDRFLGLHVLPGQGIALAGAGLVDCEVTGKYLTRVYY